MPASSFTISKGPTLSGEGPGVEGISLAEILERVPSGVPVPHRPRPAGEVVVGVLAGLDRGEVPLVAFDAVEAFRPLAASAIVDVSQADVGRRVVLAFNRGNLDQPIILGFLRSEEDGPAPNSPPEEAAAEQSIAVDGETLCVDAKQRIELRCGKASIVLTADGNILIRGAYVVSRASGTNRIRGGNVHIN